MKTTPRLNRNVQLAFGSAILTLLIVGMFSYRGIIASSEKSDRWVRHSYDVVASLQDWMFAMRGIESNSRGFALTGNEAYVESYRADMARAERDRATVGGLTADNPAQQHQFPVLARLAAEKIQFADLVMGLRRTQGLEATANAIRSGPGQKIMDEFQSVVGQMQEEELRVLALRNAEAKQHLAQNKAVLIFGTVLGLLITAAAGWVVQRDNSRGRQTEEALRDSEEKYRTASEPRSQREQGIGGEVPRAAGSGPGRHGGGESSRGYRAAECSGGETIWIPPR